MSLFIDCFLSGSHAQKLRHVIYDWFFKTVASKERRQGPKAAVPSSTEGKMESFLSYYGEKDETIKKNRQPPELGEIREPRRREKTRRLEPAEAGRARSASLGRLK